MKLGTGLERIELEEETTAHLFAALWEHTEGCRVTKRRYRIPDGAAIWEIDEFRDRELVLAEKELVPSGAPPALVSLPAKTGGAAAGGKKEKKKEANPAKKAEEVAA